MTARKFDLAQARQCRERAEQAERMAADVTAPDLRDEYSALARMWRDLAEEIEGLHTDLATRH